MDILHFNSNINIFCLEEYFGKRPVYRADPLISLRLQMPESLIPQG